MTTKEQILQRLIESDRPLSGEELAASFHMTRAGIWKIIRGLQQEGYSIRGKRNQGYVLDADDCVLDARIIASLLHRRLHVETFESIDSTSTYAKRIASGIREDFLICAAEQTQGRGRRGNTFLSPKDGCYFSLGIHPEQAVGELSLVTIRTVVAIRRILEDRYDVSCSIKWVNDLYFRGKKCGGILTEATTDIENGTVDTLFIGVGINVNQKTVDESISEIATALPIEHLNLNRFIAEIVDGIFTVWDMSEDAVLNEYREHMILMGREITFSLEGKSRRGTVCGVDRTGQLLVQTEEGTLALKCGEVSLTSAAISGMLSSNGD